jgi:PAS domain S-box-containing protein
MSRSAILSTAKKTARKSRAASRARVAAGPAIRRSQATTSEVSERLLKYTKVAVWEGALAPLRIDSVSPQHLSAFSGLKLDSSRPQAWNDVVHPLDRERVAEFFNRVETQSLPASIEYRVVDAQGSVVWIRHGVDEIFAARTGLGARGWIEDIQREKEFQLESLRVSEREQQRIGQDLHDDLCQVLAGLSCLMRVVESRIAAKAPEEVATLKELNQQLVDAMLRTRALTHGLFPGKVQVSDIRGALLELVSQVRARFAVEIHTKFEGRFPKHSPAQIIQIYRIVQEAINNALKHGRAKKIDVLLEARADRMELTVTDDGSGLTHSENPAPGVGLSIMNYRAAALGGEIVVQNTASHGVVVRLKYPFVSA